MTKFFSSKTASEVEKSTLKFRAKKFPKKIKRNFFPTCKRSWRFNFEFSREKVPKNLTVFGWFSKTLKLSIFERITEAFKILKKSLKKSNLLSKGREKGDSFLWLFCIPGRKRKQKNWLVNKSFSLENFFACNLLRNASHAGFFAWMRCSKHLSYSLVCNQKASLKLLILQRENISITRQHTLQDSQTLMKIFIQVNWHERL